MFYNAAPIPSIVDIENRLAFSDVDLLPPLRVGVLRNVTVEPLEPYLQYLACEMGFRAEVTFGGFDNFFQEALGVVPGILEQKLDVVLIFTPLCALSSMLDLGFAALSNEQVREECQRLIALFGAVVKGVRAQTDGMILWHGVEAPVYPALGIQDTQLQNGQAGLVALLNEGLREALVATGNAFLVNTQTCVERVGARQFYDTRYWHLARAPYARKGLAEIAFEDFKFIRSLKGKTRKCLVLDCDNTLWGGIVGEDGLEGIRVGRDHPGSAFLEFQLEVLSHYHRGVIVALCSKNNEDDVWEVFDKQPDMVLKREHIAAWRINWEDKVGNLRALAAQLNIGTESMVFVDDSDFEINLVRQQMPEVQVLQLPKERPGEYRWLLAACGAFDLPYLTEEDRKRGVRYQVENTRKQIRAEATDLEAYCRSLGMVLEIGMADAFSIPRIAQQTQKTNQFNLTTKRYSEADIARFRDSADCDVFWLKITDKFGDLGIVGSCVVIYRGQDAVIDTLLLSCRALGRGVEARFVSEVMRMAQARGARRILGQYIPTAKNGQVSGFYRLLGFREDSSLGEAGEWSAFELEHAPRREPGVFASVKGPLDA